MPTGLFDFSAAPPRTPVTWEIANIGAGARGHRIVAAMGSHVAF